MAAVRDAEVQELPPPLALEAAEEEAPLLPQVVASEEGGRRSCARRLPLALAGVALSSSAAIAIAKLAGEGALFLHRDAVRSESTSLLSEECKANYFAGSDCGWPGMTPEQCEAKGCCWDESSTVHWCWGPSTMLWECNFEAANGEDCESHEGITQAECEAKGCCYDEASPGSWCFKKTKIGMAGGGDPGSGPSLFCFAVVFRDQEKAVLALQQNRGTGIFGCNDWKTINGHTESDKGGGLTASWTNVDTFIASWKSVDGDGRWKNHAWTVKADPDTAWLPQRLRDWLGAQGDPGAGAFINNCVGVDDGFYGALEVMSSGAVATFLRDIDMCFDEMQDRKGGMGEDLFAQWCMESRGVQGWDFPELICNGDCECDPRPCNTGRIAYHPFKGVEDHEYCLNAM